MAVLILLVESGAGYCTLTVDVIMQNILWLDLTLTKTSVGDDSWAQYCEPLHQRLERVSLSSICEDRRHSRRHMPCAHSGVFPVR